MAFVFCDNRWKKNKQNKQPGPGQYSTQALFNNEQDMLSQPRPITSFKNRRNDNSNPKPQQKAVGFKQWLNSGIFKRDIQLMNQQTDNAKIRKGKLYRNATCIMKKDQNLMGDQQKQYDFKINNQKERTWGNKKIVQLLSDHKQKESKTDLLKKSCSSSTLLKHNINSYQLRQKLNGDLKDLQFMLPVNFKSQQVNNDLKSRNHEKSAKQKEREANNNIYSKTAVKSELVSIEQHFEICPSNFHKSSQKQQEQVNQKLSGTSKKLKTISKEQIIPAGSSEYLFQDSMEYIDTNMPGPGSYSINSSAITAKPKSKVQKFGVTIQRFKLPQKIFHPQTPINPSYPDFKATSQASQQVVGFGKTTKEQKLSKSVHNGVFYEDSYNLENKVKKIQAKGEKQKIVFGSCKQRFDSNVQKGNIEEQSYYDENEEQDGQIQIDKKMKIPTNIFLSKASRDFPVNTSMEDVDFSGQNYNCLAYKLKKEKAFYQDYEIKAAPFSSKQQRLKSIEQPVRIDKEVQLKIEKAKQQKKKKKQKAKIKEEKGFKFPKQIRKNSHQKNNEQSPSPNKYLNSLKWVKSSYNIRFS